MRILRSAPGAHLLDVENSVGRVRAKANMMLTYIHDASKMICWAILHAFALLNVLSSPDSTRPALAIGLPSWRRECRGHHSQRRVMGEQIGHDQLPRLDENPVRRCF